MNVEPNGANTEREVASSNEDLLTLEEAAQFLGSSATTLYRLLKQDDLPGLKIGRQWRFRKNDLLAHLSRSAGAVTSPPTGDLDVEIAFFCAGESEARPPEGEGEDGEARVKRLALGILHFALDAEEGVFRSASDVHLQPVRCGGDEYLRISLRFVSGLERPVREIRRMPMSLQQPLVKAFKRLADIEMSRARPPVEGCFFLRHGDEDVMIPVRCLPTTFGEDIAIRLCAKPQTVVAGLDEVGFTAQDVRQVREWLRRRHGLIVLTGLGQQKQLLYNCVSEVAGPDRRTIIVEECQDAVLPHAASVPVNGDTGLSFGDAIRAVHNHDPDVILIESARDAGTAHLVHELAFTEYLVLTAVPAHSSAEAVRWLLAQEIEPLVVARTLTGIVAQWRARRICEHCREPLQLSASDPVLVRLQEIAAKGGYSIPPDATFFQGRGCERCANQGYMGTVALFEVMPWNEALTDALLRGAGPEELTRVAVAQGMRTLLGDGLSKAAEGKTTLNEVLLAGMATI